MKAEKILEMLYNNQIEPLKALLMDEVYKNNLIDCGAKQRYSAMKRFFKYTTSYRDMFKKPCKNIDYQGTLYNSFASNDCAVLTGEDIGEIDSYDNRDGDYINMNKIITLSDKTEITIHLDEILARAAALGYKYSKKELETGYKYVLQINNTYYKIGLIDKSYSIIKDGTIPKIYINKSNKKSQLIIKNNIGICLVCPFTIPDDYVLPDDVIKLQINV